MKTSMISTYREIFIEAKTKRECASIMKKYAKKGFKADKPIRKHDGVDDDGMIYFIFMTKETGVYINGALQDITAAFILKNDSK